MSTLKLDKLLQGEGAGGLGEIVRRARDMTDLAEALRASLPAECAPNLLAANLRDNEELVLICSSSSWAARLRFESAALLDAAAAAGVKAQRCTVRVTKNL